jgi:hypothetical protein
VSWLEEGARAVLEGNWREGETAAGTPFAYARPDRDKFPAQFYWDSCFHALAWARLRPARGRQELRTLVAAQEPDGFIGHTIFWDAPIRRSRRPFYNVIHPADRMTRTIQPPFLGLAWEAVAAASDDDAGFAREGLAPLAAHYDWLARERDPDGSGLLAIVQPDECGLDAAPKFDRLLGWRAAGWPGFPLLVRQSRRDRFALGPIARRGGFVVREVLVNVAYALSLASLARLGAGDRFAERAARVRSALLARCLDPASGLFLDEHRSGPLRVSTWASLAPIALPELPGDVAARLVSEHVANAERYWLPFGIPSTAADEKAFRPSTRMLRYWRGPTWLPCSWLVHRGLVAHGFDGLAVTLADRVSELVRRSGFREYYDPYTGAPMGARTFGMSTLAAVVCAA